jgi:hypothetical protein
LAVSALGAAMALAGANTVVTMMSKKTAFIFRRFLKHSGSINETKFGGRSSVMVTFQFLRGNYSI